MRFVRRLIAVCTIGMSVVVAVAATLVTMLWRSGYAPADFPQAVNPKVARTVTTQMRAGRTLRHVTIVDSRLGEIGFYVSLPDPLPRARMPVIFANS